MEAHAIQFKKKRDPERFEQAQHDIAELIKLAETGEIELAYVDEAGLRHNRRIVQLGQKAVRCMPLQQCAPNA
ncbi:hypothetical protein A1359_11475 [Methylomonas lenta]|uniref:Uncharacterized protein n=1 Tax=Methylomonas lenta TaxID=980561 RepID=A0A177N8G3_9GAMM|nr:hypothetical protein [Methylomonas lenta]OAI14181.1 hypothetical protein A1359_11475 [Methylomonas lenta]